MEKTAKYLHWGYNGVEILVATKRNFLFVEKESPVEP